MAGKLSGGAIQSGTITTTQISSALNTTISAGGGPKISTIIYPGDDTAANTNGGQTLYITGSGFKSNSTVYINGNNVPSVSFISASNLSFTGPVLSAATYPVYVINPEDGATAILIPGLQVSGEPTWVTSATLSEQDATGTWNISLSATGDAPLTYALAAGSSLPGGITLASNGVISGTITTPPENDTTYNFTVNAIDAQNQSSSRAFSVTATTGEGVLFANNVLLIHADGTNNGNNHSFLDSSNNNFTITRFGNATQGSYSPFSQTGWSAFFDGSGDYLSVPYTTANFNWWTSDFTLEAWVYPTNLSTWQYIDGPSEINPSLIGNADHASANNYWSFGPIANGTVRFKYYNGASVFVASTATVNLNAWNHIALTKTSSGIRIWVNGVGTTVVAVSGTPQSSASYNLVIGQINNASIAGHVSNLRIIKGTALYNNNFTPPSEPLAPIANTSLLALQSNRLIDDGPNNLTLTRNGDVSVQAFSPFAPGLLSSNSHSVYFDGNGDSLSLPINSEFLLGTGDCCIEAWIYTSSTAGQMIYDERDGSFGNPSIAFEITASQALSLFSGNYSPSTAVITGGTIPLNTWTHVAFSRNSGTNNLYINGTRVATNSNVWDQSGTATSNYIGVSGTAAAYRYFVGYISNFRIVKGAAVYTGTTITVPTSPLTAVSNTSLLTCQSTTFVDNSTNAFTITPNGNVAPRKFNPFGQTYTIDVYSTANVGGSVYYDGTGDYLSSSVDAHPRGTEDFTIEFWYYLPSGGWVAGDRYFLESSGTGTLIFGVANYGNDLMLLQNTSGTAVANFGSKTQVKPGQWSHIAVTRSGNSFRCYINGSLTSSGVVSNSTSFSTPSTATNIGSSGNLITGHISNLKITRGLARYTAPSILPPSAPLVNDSNTNLLLNFTNAQIFDQTAKNVLECIGDAKVSTAQYKYGTGSIAFDGTGDKLVIPHSPLQLFGTGDFTIEFWYRGTIGTVSQFVVSKYTSYPSTAAYFVAVVRNNHPSNARGILVGVGETNFLVGSNTIQDNTWYHIAVTRASNSVKVFVDGTQVGATQTISNNITDSPSLIIGDSNGSDSPINGYIDDLRITKGHARYTANFTAPTAKFKDK